MLASEKGHTDIVKILLAVPGIDVNVKDNIVSKQVIVVTIVI